MSLKVSFGNKIKSIDWLFITIIVIAVFFRFFMLDVRPPHHDEGVFGWFVDQITANGFYRYDPNNYHGPFHYYLLYFFQTLFGRNIWVLRLPDVLISVLSVYWITLFSRFIERRVCLIAAFCMAVSPGVIYYSRYPFQEAFIVFYAIIILWGIIGLWKEGSLKYLWSIGIGLIFMILTKETFVINIACFIFGFIYLFIEHKCLHINQDLPVRQLWTIKDLIWVVGIGLLLIFFFYSETFYNLNGIYGLFKTFQAYFSMGMKGSGHNKPFIYWFMLICRYEHIVLISLFLTIRYFIPSSSSRWIRYIAIYGFSLYLIYSIIHYKTPWCIINFLWPFYFLFGDTVVSLLKTKWHKEVIFIVGLLFLSSIFTSIKLNFINYADNKEPYVYVHTFRDINKFTAPLLQLAKNDPANYNLTGSVLRSGEWPLPWLLGDFTMVGYYGNGGKPQNYDAGFLIVESKRIREVEENLQNKYFTDTFTLRDSQDTSKLYFDYEKFKNLYPGRIPEFIPSLPEPIIPGQGLLASYYSNIECMGNVIKKRVVRNIDFYQDEQSTLIAPPFGLELIGEINIPSSDTTLILSTDDGGYLEIDGQRVIEDLGSHGEHVKSITIKNKQGWRKIKIGCYDIWGYFVLRLKWIDTNGNEVFVPASALRFNGV